MTACKRLVMNAVLLVLVVLPAGIVSAQVTGTTGAIIGTVTDNTKAVVPGVTITVRGPALMGTRTVVTGPDGAYRIPALPPGAYTLAFDLEGFETVKREGLQITVGFTATINVEMSPAGVAESVTVSGSPVVDLASTKVTTDVSAEQLANLVGARDHATVMSLMPGVTIGSPDVGGSGSITYQRYTSYGINSQNRGEVEGMVTTESANFGEVFYGDFSSYDDMAVNVVGNTAEMPMPGALTVAVAKSGGNTYHGHVYQDYQSGSVQAHNIDASQLALGVTGGASLAANETNRLVKFRDFSADLGGFVIKDKLWWYAAYRYNLQAKNYPNLVGEAVTTTLPVRTGKVTYNLTPNNKLIGYYARSIKKQDNYIAFSTQIATPDAVQIEEWPSGTWKGEYDAVLGDAAMIELRAGNYYEIGIFDGKGANPRYQDVGSNRLIGTDAHRRAYHGRPQMNGSFTYFKNGWAGTHSFKFGGEFMQEVNESTIQAFNNLLMILNNGAPSQVQLYLPGVLSRSLMWASGGYGQDTWKVTSRVTLNLGLRFDQYRSFSPAQVGPTGQQFQRFDAPVLSNLGPRIGFVYALTGDGKTVVKANYGQYWEFPYNSIAGQINPNPTQSFSTYTWTPANPAYVNGLPVYQPGQEGRLLSVTGARADGQPATTIDPNLENAYSRQATTYVERELAHSFGLRGGFVWNVRRQAYARVNTSNPFSAFTVPVTVTDPGPDGRLGTADDAGSVQAFNLAPAYLTLAPVQVVQNIAYGDGDFYTWELTANRRKSGRWSLLGSVSETWHRAATSALTPNALINTVDGRNAYKTWTAKISGTLDMWGGVRFSPMLRHQSGAPFARTFNANLNYSTAVAILAEPFGARRTPNVTLLDLRTEKNFKVGPTKVGVFLDLYNILNANPAQAVTASSGSAFLRPTAITGPRIARVGAKFDF